MASVIECIELIENERGQAIPSRYMFGPFETFKEAHEWMTMMVAAKRFDVCLIHTLNDPKTAFAEIRSRKNANGMGDVISKA